MNAIILAAGFGSRLMPLTQDTPKCMVKAKHKKIIDYEISALRESKIDQICVVGGYCFEKLKNYLQKQGIYQIFCNEHFSTTNMVVTLFKARDYLLECIKEKQDLIVSYADIIYQSKIVEALMQAQGELCIVVDSQWKELWDKRFENPLSDAETLKISMGKIKELGKKPKTLDEIEGQYIGLFKFSYQFLETVIDFYESLDPNLLYDGKSFEQMYMTSFLQLLIDRYDCAIPVMIERGWWEIDSCKDLEIFEQCNNY